MWISNYYLHHSTLLIHFVCNNSVDFAPWTSTTPWERPFFNSCMKMLWFFLANKLPCNFLWKFKAPIFFTFICMRMWRSWQYFLTIIYVTSCYKAENSCGIWSQIYISHSGFLFYSYFWASGGTEELLRCYTRLL